jgi:pilus assembly protein Flp/PilA
LVRDRSGATAIEYALIAGAIAMLIVAVLQVLGSNVLALFQSVLDGLG